MNKRINEQTGYADYAFNSYLYFVRVVPPRELQGHYNELMNEPTMSAFATSLSESDKSTNKNANKHIDFTRNL